MRTRHLSSLYLLLCIIAVPGIAQPAGKVAGPSILTVDPASPTDLITQVNALFAACSGRCEVHIPAGDYTVTTGTIRMTTSRESLTGDGRGAVRIAYAGINFLDWRLTQGTYDFVSAGKVAGFTVFCNNPAAHCMTTGSVIGNTFEDLNVYGPQGIASQLSGSAGTSEAFTFQNTFNWMERWVIRNVTVGGFKISFHFLNPIAPGTNSFGYGLMDGVFSGQAQGTTGIVIENNAQVYNMLGLHYQFNLSGDNSAVRPVIFDIRGLFTGVGLSVTGENAGQYYTFAHLACGAHMTFQGAATVFGLPSILTDCPAAKGEAYAPYTVDSDVGLGAESGSVGAPNITGYMGPGDPHTYSVHPFMTSRPGGNGSAMLGVLTRDDGLNTLYASIAPGLDFCVAARNPFLTISSLGRAWCVDSSGNVTGGGTLSGGAYAGTGNSYAYLDPTGTLRRAPTPIPINTRIDLSAATIPARTCTPAAMVSMTGATPRSVFISTFATDPNAIPGWGASGGLTLVTWPTQDALHWRVCNSTATPITTGAVTMNVSLK